MDENQFARRAGIAYAAAATAGVSFLFSFGGGPVLLSNGLMILSWIGSLVWIVASVMTLSTRPGWRALLLLPSAVGALFPVYMVVGLAYSCARGICL